MKAVDVSCWVYSHASFTYGEADCFAALLLEAFNTCQIRQEYRDLLASEIGKRPFHPQDALNDLFENTMAIGFDFAKGLGLYDTITPSCFIASNPVSSALVSLLESAGLRFVFYRRTYLEPESMWCEFIVAHEDFTRELHEVFLSGKFKD